MTRCKGIIFDLDGTLADTLHDIAAAMNHTLRQHGLPTHPVDAYRQFVGEGVSKLAERALPPSEQDRHAAVVADFRRYYRAHLIEETRPYPGVLELLENLRARGLPSAVLSNKPHEATCDMVAALFPGHPFSGVMGHRPETARKPDPGSALQLAADMRLPPADVAFVGDTFIDIQTARAAHMLPLGVLWGFRRAEELKSYGAHALLEHPGELLAWCADAGDGLRAS